VAAPPPLPPLSQTSASSYTASAAYARTLTFGAGAASLSRFDPSGPWGGAITVTVADDAASGLPPGAAFATPFRLRISTAPVPGSLRGDGSTPLTALSSSLFVPATPLAADGALAASLAQGGYWPFGRPERFVSLTVQSRGAPGPAGAVLTPTLPPGGATVHEGGGTVVNVSLSQAPAPGTFVTLVLSAGIFTPGLGVAWGDASLTPAAIGSVLRTTSGLSIPAQVRR